MISNGGRAEDGLWRREPMVKSNPNPQQNDFTLGKGFGRRAFDSQGVASDVDEDVSAS